MTQPKEIEIIIKQDGTVEVDQKGWDGKECSGQVNDIVQSLGKKKKTKRKQSWFKKQDIQIRQHTTE
jgi:hypothetical protein